MDEAAAQTLMSWITLRSHDCMDFPSLSQRKSTVSSAVLPVLLQPHLIQPADKDAPIQLLAL